MALNEMLQFTAAIHRQELEDVLAGIAGVLSPYLSRKMPAQPTIADFLLAFPECPFGLTTKEFPTGHVLPQSPYSCYFQTRINPPNGFNGGRVAVRYDFKTCDAQEGKLIVSRMDNGEEVSEHLFTGVYDILKSYIQTRGLNIIKEQRA